MILNLTPHTIHIVADNGDVVATIEPAAQPARVRCTVQRVATLDGGVPLSRQVFGQVENLPAPVEGTFYVVSALCAAAVRASGDNRSDLLVPAEQVRNTAGQVTGCRSLALA